MKEDIQGENLNYRPTRCSDCGFTKSTDANNSGLTAIKAQLSAEIPEPFLCHFNARNNELPEDKKFMCQGWVERCNELNSEGFYEKQPRWQSEMKSRIVETICEIEELNVSEDIALEMIRKATVIK